MKQIRKFDGEFLRIEKDSNNDFVIHWVDASNGIRWNRVPGDNISLEGKAAESEIRELEARLSKTNDPKRVEDLKQKIQHFQIEALWPEMYKAYCKDQSLDTFFEGNASSDDDSKDRKSSDDDSKDRLIQIQNTKILKYRNDKKYPACPDVQALFDIADKCRLKNGKINISKLAKKLGKSDKTARDWCDWKGVK